MAGAEDKLEARVATSIKIRPSVWRAAKVEAAKRGVKLSELVETAILRQLRRTGGGD